MSDRSSAPRLGAIVQRWPRLREYETEVVEFIHRRARAFGVDPIAVVDAARDASFDPRAWDAVVVLRALNPLTDYEALPRLIALARERQRPVRCTGMVPGTEIDLVVPASILREGRLDEVALGDLAIGVDLGTQARFDNQLNLFKFKRVRMFRGLAALLPDLASMPLAVIADRIADRDVHRKLLTYFAPVELRPADRCPHCGSERFEPLHATVLQPLVGYLSPRVPTYRQCADCTLAWLFPQIEPGGTHHLYDAFDQLDWHETDPASSYVSRYGVVLSLLERHAPERARLLDLGGGIGGFAHHVKREHPYWSVTHSDFGARRQDALHAAGVETRTLNFLTDPIGDEGYDIITALEVIEHVSYGSFRAMLENVRRALLPGGLFAFSTPDLDSPLVRAFDFFQAYVPHHFLIFTRRWIESFFANGEHGFRIVARGSSADLLDGHDSYFSYCEDHASTIQARAAATLLRTLLDDPQNRARLLEADLGAEMIFVLRKSNQGRG